MRHLMILLLALSIGACHRDPSPVSRPEIPEDFTWTSFLETYDQEIRSNPGSGVSDALDESGRSGLGFDPASATEIAEAEERLGVKFPPSYRNFLSTSNGWACTWLCLEIIPVSKVERLRDVEPDTVEAWLESVPEPRGFEDEKSEEQVWRTSLNSALLISDYGHSGYAGDQILLIPNVVFKNGEWEVWDFSPTIPGEIKYRSFTEFMWADRQKFLNTIDVGERARRDLEEGGE